MTSHGRFQCIYRKQNGPSQSINIFVFGHRSAKVKHASHNVSIIGEGCSGKPPQKTHFTSILVFVR